MVRVTHGTADVHQGLHGEWDVGLLVQLMAFDILYDQGRRPCGFDMHEGRGREGHRWQVMVICRVRVQDGTMYGVRWNASGRIERSLLIWMAATGCALLR